MLSKERQANRTANIKEDNEVSDLPQERQAKESSTTISSKG